MINLDTISIRSDGDRVVILKNGLLVADLNWHAARELGQALQAKADESSKVHWAKVRSRLGRELEVKEVFGMPVLTEDVQMERLG